MKSRGADDGAVVAKMTLAADLNSNTIEGRRVSPRIVELVKILNDGPVATDDVIARLYGINEPENASQCISQFAFQARAAGIPIKGRNRKRGGFYYLDVVCDTADRRILAALTTLGIPACTMTRLTPVLRDDVDGLEAIERLASSILWANR